MSKSREAVTCNGRPAFYAAMYEDIRQCAMERGWAVALHGSLSSDMDIMAMPWEPWACSFKILVMAISTLFDGNSLAENYKITYHEKPCGRIVATIPIFSDFYLDISTMPANVKGRWRVEVNHRTGIETVSCSNCQIKHTFPIGPGVEVLFSNFCPNCGAQMGGAEDG